MKQTGLRIKQNLPPLVALVLLLTVIALASTPWVLSRYAATGTGGDAARVAKFAPVITLDSSWPTTTQNKFVLFNQAIGKTQTYSARTFTVTNNGETTIKVVPHLYYAGTKNDVAGVSFAPASAVLAYNGGAQSFTMSIAYAAGHTVGQEYTVELSVHAEQVD